MFANNSSEKFQRCEANGPGESALDEEEACREFYMTRAVAWKAMNN